MDQAREHAKFLHLADTHFDAPMKCKDVALRKELREATFVAFENAVADALVEQVDAVLMAGDLFNGERISLETEARLCSALARLGDEGIPVVAVSGNHDPSVNLIRGRTITWPENVRFVGSSVPETISITSRRDPSSVAFVLVAAGHEHAAHDDNLVARFPTPESGLPHVGLVHAMVSSHSSSGNGMVHDKYAPCTPDDLKNVPYAYWALGHVHVPQQIMGTNAFYSGCIQGRHHKEGGPRGGYLVTISDDGVATADFRDYAPVVWEEIVLDRTVPDDLPALEVVVSDEVELLGSRRHGCKLVIRLVLRGQSSLYEYLRDPDEMNAVKSRWIDRFDLLDLEVDVSSLFARVDLAWLRNEPTVVSETITLIEQLIDEVSTDSISPPRLPVEIIESIAGASSEVSRSRWEFLLRDLQLEAAERMVDLANYKLAQG